MNTPAYNGVKPPPPPTAPTPAGGRFFTFRGQAQKTLKPGQSLRFATGKGYYAGAAVKPIPKPTSTTAAPGNPTTTAPQLTDAQLAQQQVSSIVNPFLSQIQSVYGDQLRQAAQAVTGYNQDAMSKLAGIDLGAPYRAAASDQNAVTTALLANLKGQGATLQNQLSGVLSGNSDAAPINQALGNAVMGAAGAGLAKGDAVLSDLLQRGAAAQTYGLEQPGIQALAGRQQLSGLANKINTAEQTQLGNLEAQVPKMTQDALSAINTGRYQQGELAARNNANTIAENRITSNERIATAKDEVAALIASGKVKEALAVARQNNLTKIGIANANNATRTGIANANNQRALTVAGIRAQNQEQANALKAGKIDAQVSKLLGYAATSTGQPILTRGGAPIPVKKTGSTGVSGLTANEIQKYRGQAETLAYNAFFGVKPDPNNSKVIPAAPLSYSAAIEEARRLGIPVPIVVTALNRHYQPGQRGRPVTVGMARGAAQVRRNNAQARKGKDQTGLGVQVTAPTA
jgi:hypothetical protein